MTPVLPGDDDQPMSWPAQVLAVLGDEEEAIQLRDHLLAAGIHAVVTTERIDMHWDASWQQIGPKVLVRRGAYDEAWDAYVAWWEELEAGAGPRPSAAWTCPTCGEKHGPQMTDCWSCGVSLGAARPPAYGPRTEFDDGPEPHDPVADKAWEDELDARHAKEDRETEERLAKADPVRDTVRALLWVLLVAGAAYGIGRLLSWVIDEFRSTPTGL